MANHWQTIYPMRSLLTIYTNRFKLPKGSYTNGFPFYFLAMKFKIFIFFVGAIIVGCQKENSEEVLDPYVLRRPEYFPEITYPISGNQISKSGFELGKKLFNDPILSLDNSIACSNCHVKAVAFTDPQHNPSIGIFEKEGSRNSPMIANMAFQPEFLWDGGITHLDFVPIFAIENEKEMAETAEGVVRKLNASPIYPTLFKKTFPSLDTITAPYMLKALSQYMLLLVSDQSKYDQFLRGEVNLSSEETAGLTLFKAKCASCHSGALFTNYAFLDNGLDFTHKDIGRALISARVEDTGKFKVPSLRNILLTSPYMHDGRFKTINEVIDHYRFHVKDKPNLDVRLKTDGKPGLPMSDQEVENLVSFFKTLTDYKFISNPIF